MQFPKYYPYFLFLLLPLFLQAQTNRESPLAINLAGIASWNDGYPFTDIMKVSRTWISQCQDCEWGEGNALPMDDLGWVTDLPTNHWAETVMLDEAQKPSGAYTLLFDGEGQIEFYGDVIDTTFVEPGHWKVQIDGEATGGIWMRILETDPNETGEYIRNIRLIMPGYEDTYETDIFYPLFLDTWKNYSTLRFMDWGSTNHNPSVTWAERTRPNHQTQGRAQGVAPEYMIALSNQLQTDAWFCIPHAANDDYITQLATLIRDNLDDNLKVYIEYSNEVWNWQFDQAHYAAEQGVAQGLDDNGGIAQIYFHAKRSVEIFDIFESVFGSLNRLERVIAWQNFSTYGTQLLLDYNNTYQSTDALSIAPYFGGSLGSADTQDEIAALSVEEILDRCESELAFNMDGCRQQANIANARGLSLIAYEGGQHLVGILGAENNVALTNKFIAVNRHPRMQQLYQEYYERWKLAGGELFAVFSSMGTPSKWGSWSVLETYQSDPWTAPKYAASEQFMAANNPAWWLNPSTDNYTDGTKIIDFQGTDLPSQTISRNRDFTSSTRSQIIPFSLANGSELFTTTDNQSTFYGGIKMEVSTGSLDGHTYTLSNYGTNDLFITAIATGEGIYSDLEGLFLWRKDQFLNGYDTQEQVSIDKLRLDLLNFTGDSSQEFRFVIKNGGQYYISDFMTWSNNETFELYDFNNSTIPGKRWYLFTPTANDFEIPAILTNPVTMTFDDVQAVGFAFDTHREYHTDFAFNSFEVFARPTNQFTVQVNQAIEQADPTAEQPIQFVAQFSEATTDFVAADIVLSGTATDENTQVSITEIAPQDGTTYQITVNQLAGNGQIMVQIPADVATNSSGVGNNASTSSDNIIAFNGANQPTVSIEQADAQDDPTWNTPIFFQIVFSQSIMDFDASDLQFGGTANPTQAIITELMPFNGTTFEVAVYGMTNNGTVTLDMLADQVKIPDFDIWNQAATGDDREVNYLYEAPTNGTMIHFDGTQIPDDYETYQQNRTLQSSADGLSQTIPFSLADNESIYTAATYDQMEFYGGFHFQNPDGAADINMQIRNNDDGFEPNRFWCDQGGDDGDETIMDMLFLWRKDQFLNNMNSFQVGFNNDPSESLLEVNVTGARTNVTLRFVIKNGDTYYISEASTDQLGTFQLTAFNNSNEIGKRWAVYTPTANAFGMPNPLSDFQAVQFDDVTAVGFLFHSERDTYNQFFSFDQFRADGVTVADCKPDLVLSLPESSTQTGIAQQTITSTATIATTANVTYQAGESITLLPNFQVVEGAAFAATIAECPPTNTIIPSMSNTRQHWTNSDMSFNDASQLNIYPNPFQDQTTIVYELQTNTTVELWLYDYLGRPIRQLNRQTNQEAGQHAYILKNDGLTMGTYFLIYQTPQQRLVEKIAIVY